MKVSAEMMYLGTESGTTRDGKTYVRAGLLQGLNSEVIYLNEENQKQVASIKPMTPVICTLNISIGERTYVNLLDISPNQFNDSGKGTTTWRSKRPGRNNAGSKTSGRFDAAITMVPLVLSKPSISTNN